MESIKLIKYCSPVITILTYLHRKMLKTEEQVKVIAAAACGAKLIQFLAALVTRMIGRIG